MTEKEKMLKEMLYDANNDEDLLKERAIAKDLCFKFNQLMPSDTVNQKKILHQLLGHIDVSTCFMSPFWCDYGYNIKIGRHFFAHHNTVILDGAEVTFGDNVWIGAGVQVMPGVTIGDNVVIGGGSVVVKDIPSNSVAVGNPCHVIREITDKDEQTNWNHN